MSLNYRRLSPCFPQYGKKTGSSLITIAQVARIDGVGGLPLPLRGEPHSNGEGTVEDHTEEGAVREEVTVLL